METCSVEKLSDEELLSELSQKSSLPAFDELYRRYWRKLYVFALKISNETQLAEDIVQELFVAFWEKRAKLNVKHVGAYLHQAVKFQVAKNVRRIQFTDAQDACLHEIAFDSSSEDLLLLNELHQQIDGSIGQLAPRCQEIFRMSRFENFTNQEIAAHFNISIRTVETQISTALKHLKNTLPTTLLLTVFSFLLCQS